MSAPAALAFAAEFEHVDKQRGDVRALQDICLAVPYQETTAILGESGSGKSTLIQLIIGLMRPDAGQLRVMGAPIDYQNINAFRRSIGYAVQGVALFPHLKIAENIQLPARLAGWSRAETRTRLEQMLDMMQLSQTVLTRYPHELSGGQQQRAGLCRAMLLRPQILLLDEPFSALDTLTRRRIHRQFLHLRNVEPVSCVLVTHDPQEAMQLASKIVVLRNGRVEQQGSCLTLIENPANDYVAELCTGLDGVRG